MLDSHRINVCSSLCFFITHLKHIKGARALREEENSREALTLQVSTSVLRKAAFHQGRERSTAIELPCCCLTLCSSKSNNNRCFIAFISF